jgi:hypothetical protein
MIQSTEVFFFFFFFGRRVNYNWIGDLGIFQNRVFFLIKQTLLQLKIPFSYILLSVERYVLITV